MFNDFRWGGINVRGFIRALLPDVWMVFAVMIITYLAIGIVAPLVYKPVYKVDITVAVYPDNDHFLEDASSERMEIAKAVNSIVSSRAFRSGLNELLEESKERTIENYVVSNTNLLSITVKSFSAEDAYNTVHSIIEYYNSLADYVTGHGQLEIVVPPEIPLEPDNSPELLNYRLLLTLFMGCVMGAFLAFLYVIRKTYKTAGSVQRQYKEVRFFRIPGTPAGKIGFAGRRKKMKALHQAAVRKTAEELRQMIRALGGKSILITSASKGEGNTDFACELADEFESLGESVLLVEADFENTGLTKMYEKEGKLPGQGILDVLGSQCSLREVCIRHPEKNILTACAGLWNTHEDIRFSYTAEDVKRVMEEAKSLANIVLVDSGVWGETGNEKIWNMASDFSLILCAPEKAEFFKEDQLVTDLSNGKSDFEGIVLNGF